MDNTLTDYQVRLEIFEGPLDLLLFLVKKEKINIWDVSLSKITREYLEYLEKKDKINLSREGDFLLWAATLIYIKSLKLLPRNKEMSEKEEEEIDLISRIDNYDKIKVISSILKEKEIANTLFFKKESPPEFDENEFYLEDINLYDLAKSFFQLLKKKEQEEFLIVRGRRFSIEEKIDEILQILKVEKYIEFLSYIEGRSSLEEAFVAFFALLELIRRRVVTAKQKKSFNKIHVWLNKEDGRYFRKRKN
ncbi:MAG: segregation/condensation protein A [Acidobacteriota bacterium]